jgi:hypothetical protein
MRIFHFRNFGQQAGNEHEMALMSALQKLPLLSQKALSGPLRALRESNGRIGLV